MKKNFDGVGTDVFHNVKTIDEMLEEKKGIEMPEPPDYPFEDEEPKKRNQEKESGKRPLIFSEVDDFVLDYFNLKSIVTGKSKKEILNEMFHKEIKETFGLKEDATQDEMEKAVRRKVKQIESMKTLFR